MSKFVVTETSVEYNDEYHYVTENEGGIPVAVFDTKQEAVIYAQNRTINDFLKGIGNNLSGYGEGIRDILSRKPSFVAMDEDAFFDWNNYFDLDEILDLENRSEDQLREIASSLAFSPYRVTEVL